MNLKFVIYSPPYDENNGGSIVLHKLCHILNKLGHQSHLYPMLPSMEVHPHSVGNLINYAMNLQNSIIISKLFYKTNPDFNTPVIDVSNHLSIIDDSIVIYPEIIFGNPLNAKNVVRWILYEPGKHTGSVYYPPGELHFLFNSQIKSFSSFGSTLSTHYLTIWSLPLEIYLRSYPNTPNSRSGTAYCLRKGKNRMVTHDLSDSILIDGKSHHEISEIFHSVNSFISYDLYTAYSKFAVLAGCNSIVMPIPGISREEWCPNPEDRYGIAYGFEDINQANSTKINLIEKMQHTEQNSIHNTSEFINIISNFFDR